MTWEILISSFALSFIILVPLGIKWEIPKRVTVPASFFIGILTGLIIMSIEGIYDIKFWQVLILELFLIMGISSSLLLWRFFGDPDRIAPEDKNAILTPADGKVIYVKRIEKGTIPYSEKKGRKFSLNDFIQSDVLPTEGHLIGISMNFLNVHVNRSPIEGRVSLIRHIKGGFLSLRRKEAVIQNERALTVIENGNFKVGVVQIASRLVRRIVSYVKEGDHLILGQKIGMIKFGSQVDILLPDLEDLRINTKVGERVFAGVTIIATYSPEHRCIKTIQEEGPQ